MQLFRLICLSAMLIFIGSCGGNEEPKVRISLEADVDIPAGRNALISHVFLLRNLRTVPDVTITDELKANIIEVFSTRGEMRGRFGPIDLSIVDDVSVRAVSRENPSLTKEVFYRENVPLDERNDLLLFSSLSNTSDILLDETVDIELSIRFKTVTSFPIEAKLFLNFEGF